MTKGLEALNEIKNNVVSISPVWQKRIDAIEKELRVVEILKSRGIALIIPDNDFSKEHFAIEVYTNTLSKEEIALLKETVNL